MLLRIQYWSLNDSEQYLPCWQSVYLHAIAISSQPLVLIIRSGGLLVLARIAEKKVLKCSIEWNNNKLGGPPNKLWQNIKNLLKK